MKKEKVVIIAWSIQYLLFSMTRANAQELRSDISLSDPFVMADARTQQYYLTGTGGGLWRSSDLESWTYLGFPFLFDDVAWMGDSPQVWASEIHPIDGQYYNFSTFTNKNVTIDSDGHPRRAVHIMSSRLPEGKYKLISGGDATYVPAEKTTLDATYFEDTDGRRYLIYCHEWIQNGNGTIEYIELKPDMTGTVGEGVVMTRAHNATWNTSPVTDGPYLFRTQTGRLGMIWTSWHGGRYVQGVAYSTTGKIDGPWKHEPLPITPDNYGHGMLFHTFDGELLMSIHSHRTIDESKQQWERHPVLFVMDDSGDRLRTIMEYKMGIGPANPTQVMVDNPEFEYGKLGWTSTTGAQNQLIATNQSGAITGNFFESWDANSYTGEIFQEQVVPNGTYRVTVAAFRSQLISGGKQDAEAVWLFANEEQTLIDSTTPLLYSVTVYVNDERLRFGLRSVKKNFRWMGIDNVSVQYYGKEQLSSDDIDQAARRSDIYLRNLRDGKFLNAGQSWGTQAVLSDQPLDLRFVTLPDGKYAIDSRISNSSTNHYASSNGYLDGSMTPFDIQIAGSSPDDSQIITLSADGGRHFWGSTGGTVVSTSLTNAQAKGAQWEVLTRDDLLNTLSDATPDTPVDATFLIQCPDFGRNDTRVNAWTVSKNCTNIKLSGGNDTNNCAESYHSPFTISQLLTDAPEGTYTLSAQGFYSPSDGKAEQPPVFFIGNATQSLPVRARSEKNMSDASVSFTANRYKIVPISFYHNGNSAIEIGVRCTSSSQWVIWDNFKLLYYGSGDTTGIDEIAKSQSLDENADMHDLSGRHLSKTTVLSRGVYILNGKKYLKTK